jgi:hypothetical protein
MGATLQYIIVILYVCVCMCVWVSAYLMKKMLLICAYYVCMCGFGELMLSSGHQKIVRKEIDYDEHWSMIPFSQINAIFP